jgi:uncharacterized protein GlcG (DUF336 family)/NAD-dependent dihydropyrimidine dehydrogenase PreA subunit
VTSPFAFSTYVITEACVGVKDGSCVEVCPVDCIFTKPEEDQFYIDPAVCIACEQCVLVCPVNAIFLDTEVPPAWRGYIEKNAEFFRRTKDAVTSVAVERAERMVQAGFAKAAAMKIGVSVAIVDLEGRLIASGRMDAARQESLEMALDKASTAAAFQMPTDQIGSRPRESAVFGISQAQLVAVPGGIPILDGFSIVGAGGVGGGTPEQDRECCRAALTAP